MSRLLGFRVEGSMALSWFKACGAQSQKSKIYSNKAVGQILILQGKGIPELKRAQGNNRPTWLLQVAVELFRV